MQADHRKGAEFVQERGTACYHAAAIVQLYKVTKAFELLYTHCVDMKILGIVDDLPSQLQLQISPGLAFTSSPNTANGL